MVVKVVVRYLAVYLLINQKYLQSQEGKYFIHLFLFAWHLVPFIQNGFMLLLFLKNWTIYLVRFNLDFIVVIIMAIKVVSLPSNGLFDRLP